MWAVTTLRKCHEPCIPERLKLTLAHIFTTDYLDCVKCAKVPHDVGSILCCYTRMSICTYHQILNQDQLFFGALKSSQNDLVI